MKILYIIDYGTVGGATHSFIEMVIQLKAMGVEPVVCLGEKTDIIQIFNQEGIEYFCAGHRTVLEPFSFKGLKWPLRFIKKLLRYYIKECLALYRLKKESLTSFDIIHTNSARNDIGCYINKKYGIPHIMHIREFADADFDCITYRPNYISLYNKYTTQFITISEAVKRHWKQKGIVENKMRTIYNGIHFQDITISSDDDKYNKCLNILIAGGVCLPKGQHLAVEALGLLPTCVRDNIFLDIAGWSVDMYVQQMKKHAESNGYGKRVRFHGTVNNLHQKMENYQIGLMCSRAEGFGRVTAEYMHAQFGVIASDSGANPELIEDGVNGLLFKSGDAQSLADCILKLYNDRDLLIRLSHEAKDKARAVYTQEQNAAAIYKLYQEILKK